MIQALEKEAGTAKPEPVAPAKGAITKRCDGRIQVLQDGFIIRTRGLAENTKGIK
jgi:hypothetical protein